MEQAKILAQGKGPVSEKTSLSLLSQEKGWHYGQISKPVNPDSLVEWGAYLTNLVGMVTIAIKKLDEFDQAFDAMDALFDIREALSGHKFMNTHKLLEIDEMAESQLRKLLSLNRSGGFAKFDQMVPPLGDLLESLERAQTFSWLLESGLSADQAEIIIDDCGYEYVGDALDYIDLAAPNAFEGHVLMVALCGIHSLYSLRESVEFARAAKRSLSNLNILYPKDVDDNQPWKDGLQYNDADFEKILETSKAILTAQYAH